MKGLEECTIMSRGSVPGLNRIVVYFCLVYTIHANLCGEWSKLAKVRKDHRKSCANLIGINRHRLLGMGAYDT